jgi:hypothetical protein
LCYKIEFIDIYVKNIKDENIDTMLELILKLISSEYDTTSNLIDMDFEIKYIIEHICNDCDFSLMSRKFKLHFKY